MTRGGRKRGFPFVPGANKTEKETQKPLNVPAKQGEGEKGRPPFPVHTHGKKKEKGRSRPLKGKKKKKIRPLSKGGSAGDEGKRKKAAFTKTGEGSRHTSIRVEKKEGGKSPFDPQGGEKGNFSSGPGQIEDPMRNKKDAG